MSEAEVNVSGPGDEVRASFVIRAARPEDCETIVNLIRELAVYEKLEHKAQATPADLRRHLFGPRPYAEALIAESGGVPIGMALFFHTFSTFLGKPGLYLEDVFVRSEARGRGVGKELLATVARIAEERGCGRVEWSVLNWNTPAIGFYVSLGAQPMTEWTVYRINDEPLRRLAALAPAPAPADPGERQLG